MDIQDIYLSNSLVSNCCGARVVMPDICDDCKEHCEPVDNDEICPECGQLPEEGACYFCKAD